MSVWSRETLKALIAIIRSGRDHPQNCNLYDVNMKNCKNNVITLQKKIVAFTVYKEASTIKTFQALTRFASPEKFAAHDLVAFRTKGLR